MAPKKKKLTEMQKRIGELDTMQAAADKIQNELQQEEKCRCETLSCRCEEVHRFWWHLWLNNE